jgi:dynein heavy chain
MLVGPTGGGKSTCFSVLQHAFNSLDSAGNSQYNKVKVKILNPKSISMGELYGEENKDTKEWTDGLASKIIRKSVEDKH